MRYYRRKPAIVFTALLIIVLAGPTATTLFSLDIGGNLDNITGVSVEEAGDTQPELVQIDKISFWVDSDVGEYFHFTMQGSWIYSIDAWNLPYPEILEFRGAVPLRDGNWPVLSIGAGRIFIHEFSKNVLSHYLDGIKVGLGLPFLNINLFSGYSGLLFTENSGITMSRLDYADKSDTDRVLAAPRFIGMAELRFIELFLGQDLVLSFLAQADLREADTVSNDAAGGKLHSQYTGIGISGPIVSALYWKSYFYLGTGSTLSNFDGSFTPNTPILSFLTGGGFRLFFPRALNSALTLNFAFSSGDADASAFTEGNTEGNAEMFVPISTAPMGVVFSPKLGNLIVTQLEYSLQPFSALSGELAERFQVQVKGFLFLRPTRGPFDGDVETEAPYLGTEADIILGFRPLSDMGFGLTSGIFFPAGGTGPSFLGRFELSYSF